MSEKATLRELSVCFMLGLGLRCVSLVEGGFCHQARSFQIFRYWNEGEATSSDRCIIP